MHHKTRSVTQPFAAVAAALVSSFLVGGFALPAAASNDDWFQAQQAAAQQAIAAFHASASAAVTAPSGRPTDLQGLRRLAQAGYNPHTYGEAENFIFSTGDNTTNNGQRGVFDAYSRVFEAGTSGNGGDYREQGDQNHDGFSGDFMNIEHLWPQSCFDKNPIMRADVGHLMGTFSHPNGERACLPFGPVSGHALYSNSGGAKEDGTHFEPPDATKGRVARGVMYFYLHWGDQKVYDGACGGSFFSGMLETLKAWNRQFPPDDFEKHRNDLVQAFQGNRNPLVDDPTLADLITAP